MYNKYSTRVQRYLLHNRSIVTIVQLCSKCFIISFFINCSNKRITTVSCRQQHNQQCSCCL